MILSALMAQCGQFERSGKSQGAASDQGQPVSENGTFGEEQEFLCRRNEPDHVRGTAIDQESRSDQGFCFASGGIGHRKDRSLQG